MIHYQEADPLGTLVFETGVEELYCRGGAESEEMSPIWVATAEQHGEDPRDIPRMTAILADRWRCRVWEREGVTLVVGRYRLLDEALRIRADLGELPSVEHRPLVTALAEASSLLQGLPDTWFIDAAEAAEKHGVSQRRMTQLISQGRVSGAHKRGRHWQVPREFEVDEHPDRPRRRPG